MHRLTILLAMVLAFSGFALAENFNGKLMDAACYDQSKGAQACDATATTSTFAVNVSGKVYKLDEAGNTKAAEAIKSRADRSADPSKATTGEVSARITGTMEGQTIKVESIEVR
jgi:hypothetical protein